VRRVLLALVAILAAIQLVPVSRTNPAVEEEVRAPEDARVVIERSCYDCHSNETRWPWYARVAPGSWLVAWDVGEAREHMNFSTWNRYDEEERRDHLEEIQEVVDEGEMPLWYYLPLHPEARLGDADKAALRAWTSSVPQVAGQQP
jgi:cbb3-type cytochrome oxidase cytochrome c subunit